jgi:NADPH:quinone reductase-like Zn-dependent oxidoreductase
LSHGTLAEYCSVPAALLGAIPNSVPFDNAATLGLAGLTAALGVWLPVHFGCAATAGGGSGAPILVYGASTAVGQYAIQHLKWVGERVVGVASAKHHAWLKSLGADQLVDYHDQVRTCLMST